MKNSISHTHTHTHTQLLFITFIFANLLVLTQITAQGDFKIPITLTHRELPADRPITASEIYSNYDALMQNPDTTLRHAKKVAQRWMAHSLPYLNVDTNGFLTNKPVNDAFQAIYTSPLQCEGNDLANWESDGPVYMPDWKFIDRWQQANGWVDAVYNNALDTNIYVLGTRTSGFMRTTDGGTTWTSVTDALDFPVLGVRQFLVDPDDPEYIMAITGTDIIEGSLIYSNDAGESWTKNQQNLPQFYSMCYHPTIDNLIIAASKHDVFISYDNGVNFNSLNAPTDDMHAVFGVLKAWNFY